MKIKNLFFPILLSIVSVGFIACDEDSPFRSLFGSDNAAGLKEALKVGSEKAVKLVGKEDGFFKDEAIKIFLPEEAQGIVNVISKVPISGVQDAIENVVLSMNRAAEDATKEAAPIFLDAIKTMTITDATGILFSDNDAAATQYLEDKTSTQLVQAFAPKINTSLDKKLVGNTSTNELWTGFSDKYNTVANWIDTYSFGLIEPLEPLNTNLSEYVTQKAMDGLFNKLAIEEEKIRTDPAARVNEVLQNVFGQLDK